MSQSKLATYSNISPNCTIPRQGKIKGVAIHCTAGNQNNTAKQIINSSRFITKNSKSGASCHYAVGGDGSIAQGCLEENRAWCTSHKIDHNIITIEVASDTTGIKVNEKAIDALVELLADICERNNISQLLWKGSKILMGTWEQQNMVVHRWTSNKACPGDTLYNRHGEIARRVNAILDKKSTTQKEEDIVTQEEFETKFATMRKKWQDNDAKEYSQEARQWAIDNGIIKGNESGVYMWEDILSREQMVTLLYRFQQLIKYENS